MSTNVSAILQVNFEMFKAKFYASLRVDEGTPLQSFDLEILRSTEDDDYIRHIKVSDNLGCLIIGKYRTTVVSDGYPRETKEVDRASFSGFAIAQEKDSNVFWIACVNPLNPSPVFADECHRYLALKFDSGSPAEVIREFNTWKKNIDCESCTWFDYIHYRVWGEDPPIAKFNITLENEEDESTFNRLHKIILYSKRDFTMKCIRDKTDRIKCLQEQVNKFGRYYRIPENNSLKKNLEKYADIGDSLSFYSLLDSEQLFVLGW